MTDLGKVDRSFFADQVAPRLGAAREDVAIGPKHGVDFGLLDLDGTALALATDPVSVLPDLGFDRAARLALHVVLSDVAVSGIPPSHLAVAFSLPTDSTDEQFGTFWRAFSGECERLGVAVATGHTARYPGASYPWVGAATVLGVGDHENVIRPDGARPGDELLVTKGPGLETAGLFASLFPDPLGERGLDAETVADAAGLLEEVRLVEDANAAAEAGRTACGAETAGVTAMHDATEGGLLGAFDEMAGSSDTRFEVDRSDVPVREEVDAVCGALDLDPWRVTSSGSMVLAVDPAAADAVVEALEARGTPVGRAGRVVEGSGVEVDGDPLDEPPEEQSWRAYADLAGRE